jgi:hypothetical protein
MTGDGCGLVALVGDDLYPCHGGHKTGDHIFAARLPACPAPFCKLPPGHRDLHDIPSGQAEVYSAPYARTLVLENLAREMLATFTKGSDGYRARAGQVQIAKWEERIKAATDA